jgi:hypothetical protein
MSPNLDDLYVVLRDWAIHGQAKTYTELSHAYKARTGDWFEPHGSWDEPLGELNQRLHGVLQAPALSAVVVKANTREPGGLFWNCAPNVPPRPARKIDRVAEYARILRDVLAYSWPNGLP